MEREDQFLTRVTRDKEPREGRRDERVKPQDNNEVKTKPKKHIIGKRGPEIMFRPLNVTNEKLYNQIKDHNFLRRLRPIEHSKNKEVNKSEFYIYPQHYRHTIEE